MFGKKKNIIDEMDDTFVDEMDVDSVDETRKFGEEGYFGDEDYTGSGSDDHLCEDGHEHDVLDKSFKERYNKYDDVFSERKSAHLERKLAKESEGGHLCEEDDHHESEKSVKKPGLSSYSDYPSGSPPAPQESFYPDGESADADLGMKVSEIGLENGSLPENTVTNTPKEKEAMAKVAAMMYEKKATGHSPLTDIYTPFSEDERRKPSYEERKKDLGVVFIVIASIWILFVLIDPFIAFVMLFFVSGIIEMITGINDLSDEPDGPFTKEKMKTYKVIGIVIVIVVFIFRVIMSIALA